jgi:hypothetical protein
VIGRFLATGRSYSTPKGKVPSDEAIAVRPSLEAGS